MTEVAQADFAGEQLTFFAAITASLSHELKNALATINEYSGLLDDLIAASEGRPLSSERLQKISSKVQKQVARSEELIQRLNRFAHSADEPLTTVDLRALLERMCDLCQRFATLARVRLERRLPDRPHERTTDPFTLQHAIYLAIRRALAAATEQRTVTVDLDLDAEGQCRIAIESADPLGPPDAATPEQQRLERLVQRLGIGLQWLQRDAGSAGPDRIVLAFPSTS